MNYVTLITITAAMLNAWTKRNWSEKEGRLADKNFKAYFHAWASFIDKKKPSNKANKGNKS